MLEPTTSDEEQPTQASNTTIISPEEQTAQPLSIIAKVEYPYIQLLQGRDGRDGSSGRDGRDGERGERGERGKKGDPGETGPPGLKGEKGERGEIGPAGPQGVTGAAGPPGPRVAGATYVRWGRTTCPTGNGTELLYSGRAAGSLYTQRGGGANLLCLPNTPDYLASVDTVDRHVSVYGVEYHLGHLKPDLFNQNAPCAVCYTPTRSTMVMIPAWTHCPDDSWTKEYVGYMMTSAGQNHRLHFECFDKDIEPVPGEGRDVNGALMHVVEVVCNTGINCPPYHGGKELTCAVCTK